MYRKKMKNNKIIKSWKNQKMTKKILRKLKLNKISIKSEEINPNKFQKIYQKIKSIGQKKSKKIIKIIKKLITLKNKQLMIINNKK